MIIKKLDIWHLKLGFQSPIKHNLATHLGSDNLVVRVTTAPNISILTGEERKGPKTDQDRADPLKSMYAFTGMYRKL